MEGRAVIVFGQTYSPRRPRRARRGKRKEKGELVWLGRHCFSILSSLLRLSPLSPFSVRSVVSVVNKFLSNALRCRWFFGGAGRGGCRDFGGFFGHLRRFLLLRIAHAIHVRRRFRRVVFRLLA